MSPAAASLVSGSSQSLAAGASQQAASLEETSASTEEIASITRKNADHALQVAGLMQQSARGRRRSQPVTRPHGGPDAGNRQLQQQDRADH